MWKAGLATFDDIKNDHQLGSESARSTYSLSRSKREKLTAVLEKQNAKPRVRTKMNRYRNSSSQEKLKNRRRNRNGKLVRSRGGNSDFSENKNHGVVGGGMSRLRKETSLPIPEDKPVEERKCQLRCPDNNTRANIFQWLEFNRETPMVTGRNGR